MLEAANASIMKRSSHVSLTFNFLALSRLLAQRPLVFVRRTKANKQKTKQNKEATAWGKGGAERKEERAFKTVC